ncbi:hypothetical protein QYF36_006484 [Acer negundo]|nr:hypothetical protein QYF36_006484 [Acer negundo]
MKEGDRAERIQGKEEGFKEIVQKKQKEVKEGWVEFDHRKQREPKESSFESNKEAVTLTVDCNRFNIEWLDRCAIGILKEFSNVSTVNKKLSNRGYRTSSPPLEHHDFPEVRKIASCNTRELSMPQDSHVPNDQFSNDGTESPKRKTFKNSNIDRGRKEASWKVKLIDKLVKMCFDRRAEFERSKGVREVSSGHEGGNRPKPAKNKGAFSSLSGSGPEPNPHFRLKASPLNNRTSNVVISVEGCEMASIFDPVDGLSLVVCLKDRNQGKELLAVPMAVELDIGERLLSSQNSSQKRSHVDNTEVNQEKRTIQNFDKAKPTYWNLDEEIAKVIEKGIALGFVCNSNNKDMSNKAGQQSKETKRQSE